MYIETGLRGISLFFEEYQVITLRILWELPEGSWTSSYYIIRSVIYNLRYSIEEDQIVDFLDELVDKDLLEVKLKGESKLYRHKYSESEFVDTLSQEFLDSLLSM